MGNKKTKWTAVEEAALLAGISKHGTGKWKNILCDAQFSSDLNNRSNIDLKDKWRNMTVSACGERSRSSKSILMASPSTENNIISGSAPTLLTAPPQDATTDAAMGDSASEQPKSKSGSEFNSMIFDALKASNSSQGSDIGMIVRYIEEMYEAPPNLKKFLAPKLRRLVARGKINKVENRYTINTDSVARVKAVGLKQKQSKPHNSPSHESPSHESPSWLESLMEASKTAAYEMAVSEKETILAKEALEEAKRVSKLAEESNCFLEMVKDIYERCSRGEVVYMNLKPDE